MAGVSIKSDRWIRRMAESEAMIEPFESGQVRESENGRIISYGTSSYGYDVRCANEFKIFTNINSAIVDPKNFDDESFVDISPMFVLFRRIPSPWRARSSTSAYPAAC